MSGVGNDDLNFSVKEANTAVPTDATMIGGSDGTNVKFVQIRAASPTGAEDGLIVRNIPSGTQTIAGTVTANIGTTGGLALETTQSTQNTRIGDLVETAPATDTASSGLNGRLQRIAQRITSLLTATSDGTQRTQITDGTNNVAVTSTSPTFAQLGLVVRNIPQSLPTFTVIAENIVLGNNKSMFAIQNTGTSIIRIRKIFVVNNQTTAVTGVAAELRLHRIASFTGGTALTPSTHDTADTLPAGITVAHASTIATETSLYKVSRWSSDEWGPGTVDVEAQDHSRQELNPWYFEAEDTKPITLRQNQGAHIRCATNTTAGSFTFTFVFTVEQ